MKNQPQHINTKWISDETLFQKYIAGTLTNDEWKELDQIMEQDEFVKDAIEGLLQVNNPAAINHHIYTLQKHLQNHVLKQSKKYRKQREPLNLIWLIAAIMVIVLACVGVYWSLVR